MDICSSCVSARTCRNAWLALKDEYLLLQKHSMMSLKKCMNKMEQKEQMETDKCLEDAGSESLLGLEPIIVFGQTHTQTVMHFVFLTQ